jgi:TPP-dependent pyruvate/acetoin dehydrogenase alpha subunit
MHITKTLADVDICKKAQAYGVPAFRVDGNNVLEVYKIAKQAIEESRHGKGPALLECMTYRWRGHVGPEYDLDKGIRSKEEWQSWVEKDPIKMLEGQLFGANLISEEEKQKVYNSVEREIDESLTFARESPFPDPSDITQESMFKPRDLVARTLSENI